ncbi:class I SAM-dependent methyltransferase [Nitratireductor aquimarinus]|uniref:SAM-dependent methyltransferase n=1 Tax=Alphaproteobacteria TaxID=28211 RepID=UPI0019D3FFAD|nr:MULTISPECIES: cyclopropane-fatty-acyl-phospholipid synthase family protein [Alphaproteobacteria]MBN7756055.1 class I SAM-dependent methyltransferase [Nitratireductor aquimarinus]MBY5998813.1 cyclopropane-fatty-acyl-phospholipid synthase family protein [Tritonibacter mobilis]MBY6020841.1 cyclopropane-fatty-acyl-phospholipid synthase family protein [Nitratireductor sp. DP7N14-4]
MNWLLEKFVFRLVRKGTLSITDAAGKTHVFGDGTGCPVHIVIRTAAAERAMALDPMLAVPERYMEGDVDIVEGDILTFLQIVYTNMDETQTQPFLLRLGEMLRYPLRRLHQFNTQARSRRNVRRHYDLSEELYRLFLDEDMQYSCAYFETPDVSLEEAQRAKKRHIMAKLALQPGHRVLDIGSGWGGLGLDIARQFDAQLLGVTLSEEQHRVSSARAREAGLADKARFEIVDYRSLTGPFDRIVSVGMFEHVGINHYRTYFDQCARLLADDGVMLLHTIGRSTGPSITNAFIRKYIFPGGYIPALSEMLPPIEKSGLIVTDVEILRIHYADTLKHWQERFQKNRARAVEIYDERFARMWEFYLAGSEASFRWQEMVVFQIQLTKRRETLPVTRDYIGETEKRLANPNGKRPGKFKQAAE